MTTAAPTTDLYTIERLGDHHVYRTGPQEYVAQNGMTIHIDTHTSIEWANGTILSVTGLEADVYIEGEWRCMETVTDNHDSEVSYWKQWVAPFAMDEVAA